MADQFPPEFEGGIWIETLDSGFTNNTIAIKWLNHFIEHLDAGPHSKQKILLIDNYRSYETIEFIKLANENHIRPYPLIPHLTHCMQPLDVGVFQPYKHWHDVAIENALSSLDIVYGLRSFLRDLPWIRQQTFKRDTIKHAFRKAGMFPVNAKECLKQLKIFNPPKEEEDNDQTLPQLPRTPTKPMEIEVQLESKQAKKFIENFISPLKLEGMKLMKGTK